MSTTGAGIEQPRPLQQATSPALLPHNRIVAFYGNPRSAGMGILGSTSPDVMLARLRAQAEDYAVSDPATPVIGALHLVAVVAQPEPGSGSLYRLRMPMSLVDTVAAWAEPDSLLVFLDIQPGRSPVLEEVKAYEEALRRPRIHLALDPEFAMGSDQIPGRQVGSLGFEDVNDVIEYLSELVDVHRLPPKILVIHRYTLGMLRDPERIHRDSLVQVVIDMDGFGAPAQKRASYGKVAAIPSARHTGIKLFYRLDAPLMTAREVLALVPTPHFVLYQ